MKDDRHVAILDIINTHDVETQVELKEYLEKAGFHTTQATVSRDIKMLHLVKETGSNGRPRFTQRLQTDFASKHEKLRNIFSEAVLSIDVAMNTVVIKTLPGMAHAAASAVDVLFNKDVVGSIAGDDCIFAVTRTEKLAVDLAGRLRGIRNV